MKYKFIFRSNKFFENGGGFLTVYDNEKSIDDTSLAIFTLMPIREIPKFLRAIAGDMEAHLSLWSYITFMYGPVYDENRYPDPILDIKVDEVYFDSQYGTAIGKRKEFEERALAFAHKALEAVVWFGLLEKGLVDKQWIADIKAWIIAHEDRILGQSADDEGI